MSRSTRAISAAMMLMLVTPGIAGAQVDAKKPPKATLDQPCTFVKKSEIGKQFGKPVGTPTADQTFLGCQFPVGSDPATPPGGTFTVVQIFPSFQNSSANGKDAFEDAHAIDVLANDELSDVTAVGKSAYMNFTKGVLTVLADKKFLFTLTWQPAGAKPLTQRDLAKLITLAKKAVARAPQ